MLIDRADAGDPDHKQVILIRKDLNMRKGKMVAQGAHASMAAILNLAKPVTDGCDELVIPLDGRIRPWLMGRFKKICLGVASEQELIDLFTQAKSAGFVCALITDAGLTEFGGVPTRTAVAIGPDLSERIDRITGHLMPL